MKTFLRNLFARKSSLKHPSKSRRVSLQLEALESRLVPTAVINTQNGSVLANVEATPVFYGTGWHGSQQAQNDVGYMSQALATIVNGPYMDMLTNGGYPVGRGSTTPPIFTSDTLTEPDTLTLTPPSSLSIPSANITNSTLTDGSIQATLQWWIQYDPQFANLQPDANRLYVIFVEPGVEVSFVQPAGNPPVKTTWTSGLEGGVPHFFGYHYTFAGQDSSGNRVNIRYAVIPFADGGAVNGKLSTASTEDTMTESMSHEVAEAVTDPDLSAYQDPNTKNEIGDLVANEYVYEQGIAVQREADLLNEQAMTPSDATPQRQVTFVLQASTRSMTTGNWFTGFHVTSVTTNALFERTPDGTLSRVNIPGAPANTNIQSISDQGIDNRGQAMIDVVFSDGSAFEYHDDGQATPLGNNVKDARAGQGVSYVLLNNGTLEEYKDGSPNQGIDPAGFQPPIGSSVIAIDAGTDSRGVNMVVATTRIWSYITSTDEFSDSTGRHYIGSYIHQASAGRNGTVAYLDGSGNVYWWNETSGPAIQFASNASKVTVGYNSDGTDVIDILFSNGIVTDYRQGAGLGSGTPVQLTSNVHDISKANAGVLNIISNDGNAWKYLPLDGDYWFDYQVLAATGSWVSGNVTRAAAVA
jgi:hypothetical protein